MFVAEGQIDNKSALVQEMAWCLPKPITWINGSAPNLWCHIASLDRNEYSVLCCHNPDITNEIHS